MSTAQGATSPSTEAPRAKPRAPRGACVAHHVPGRLRIKVEGAHGDEEFFAAVGRMLAKLEGVASVRVNLHASSVVVDYRTDDSDFAERLSEYDEFNRLMRLGQQDEARIALQAEEAVEESVRRLARHSRLAEEIVRTAQSLDRSVRWASDGYLDLKMLLPLLAAVASTLNKSRHQGTPMWWSLSTFAFSAFMSLHRDRIDAPRVRVVQHVRPRA